eukprot:3950247-Amphidinium_carterae.1
MCALLVLRDVQLDRTWASSHHVPVFPDSPTIFFSAVVLSKWQFCNVIYYETDEEIGCKSLGDCAFSQGLP